MNLINLPAVALRLHFQSFKLDISNYEKYQVQLDNVKNQVQIDRWRVYFV